MSRNVTWVHRRAPSDGVTVLRPRRLAWRWEAGDELDLAVAFALVMAIDNDITSIGILGT